jgi:hypothetical protein
MKAGVPSKYIAEFLNLEGTDNGPFKQPILDGKVGDAGDPVPPRNRFKYGNPVVITVDPSAEYSGRWTAQMVITDPETLKCVVRSEKIEFDLIGDDDAGLNVTVSEVVGRKPFIVRVSGTPNTPVALVVKPIDSSITAVPYPRLYQIGEAEEPAFIDSEYHPVFYLNCQGHANIEYVMENYTMLDKYTVCAHEVALDAGDDEELVYTPVKDGHVDCATIEPVRGDITIACDKRVIEIGDVVTFSGTNSDSTDVYLFITGVNLGEGKAVPHLNSGMRRDAKHNNQPILVNSLDGTWTFDWDTTKSEFNTSKFKIWATSVLTDGNKNSPDPSTNAYGLKSSAFATYEFGIQDNGSPKSNGFSNYQRVGNRRINK